MKNITQLNSDLFFSFKLKIRHYLMFKFHMKTHTFSHKQFNFYEIQNKNFQTKPYPSVTTLNTIDWRNER